LTKCKFVEYTSPAIDPWATGGLGWHSDAVATNIVTDDTTWTKRVDCGDVCAKQHCSMSWLAYGKIADNTKH